MQPSKNTLIIGASTNIERYSNIAIKKLLHHKHTVFAIGIKEGEAYGVAIEKEMIPFKNIHTITLYINPTLQKNYYDYILSISPSRIIFNPGTENPELETIADAQGIVCINACTLVMLASQLY
jgi:uncharacterized protein